MALHARHWADTAGCLQGLRILYQRTGRDGEWGRLIDQVVPEFIDPATGGPLPGRENQWSLITEYRVGLATAARDWPAATRLQQASITWNRDRAATALATPAGQLTPASAARSAASPSPWNSSATSSARKTIRAACPTTRKPSASTSRSAPAPRKPTWRTPSATPTGPSPPCGTWARPSTGTSTAWPTQPTATPSAAPKPWTSMGNLAYARFGEARAAGEPEPVLLAHLNTALDRYQQALALFPADDAEDLATAHNQLGVIYHEAGDTRQALRHYQQSIAHHEARGDTYGAGLTRYNIALLLKDAGRRADALLYARAALNDYEKVGPGAAQLAARTRDLITRLEHNSG